MAELDSVTVRELLKEAKRRGFSKEEAIRRVEQYQARQQGGNYQQPAAQQPDTTAQEAPQSTFMDRIGFGAPEQRTPFGLPPKAAETMFPRSAKLPPEMIDKSTPKGVGAGVADMLSLPGRFLASTPRLVGDAMRNMGDRVGTNIGNDKTFAQGVADTEGQNIGGKLLRDPLLPLSAVSGAAASKMIPQGAGMLAKTGAGAGAGAIEGLAVGGAKQALDVSQGEEFSGKELAGDVLSSAAFGGMSEIAADLLRYGLAPKMFRSAMMPNKNVRIKGFDPENIVKYDIGGSFDSIEKKAAQKISQAKEMADSYLETLARQRPDARVSVDDVIQGFLEDLDAGRLDQYFAADQTDAAEGVVDKILASFSKRGYTGQVDLPTANKAKRWLGRGVFKKGPNPSIEEAAANKVKELLDLRIRDKIQEIAPDIAKHNQVMRDLIPIKQAASDAAERYGNRNVFTGMTNMQLGQAGAISSAVSGNPSYLVGSLGMAGINNVLSPGRGAELVNTIGKEIQGVGRLGGRSVIGTRITNPTEEEEKRKAMQRQSAQFR